MLASYYNGLMLFHRKSYEYAIISFLKAEEIAKNLEEHTQLGLIYRAISESYVQMYNVNSAARYSELSLEQFEKASARKYIPYAIVDLATAYCNASCYDDAIAVAKRARMDSTCSVDSTYFPNIISVEGTAFMGKHDYENARRVYSELLDSGGSFLFSSDIRNYGIACLNTGDFETAKMCDSHLEYFDTTERLLRCFILERDADYENAMKCLEQEFYKQDSIVKWVFGRNTEIYLTDFYNARSDNEKHLIETNKFRFRLLLFIVIAFITIILLLLYTQRQRYLRKRTNLMLEIRTLKDGLINNAEIADLTEKKYEAKLEDANQRIIEAKDSIRKVLASHSYYLNEICRAYYESEGSPSEMKKVYSRAIGFINSLRDGNEIILRLETAINSHFDNLIEDLKNDCPRLTADDVNLYIYLIAGISPQAIAVILKKPVQNVYLRKSRLIEKIKKYNPEKSVVYLGFIGQ